MPVSCKEVGEPVHSIQEAIADLQTGKVIILVDDEKRENEGDFVALAEKSTPEVINFMITHGKGLVCSALDSTITTRLQLEKMTHHNTDPLATAFTVSVDHKQTRTGISAAERSTTIQALANPISSQADFKQPGHVFPLIAKAGGVLERPGHTEASVDLAKLAGAAPAAVICEIIKDDGKMARLPDLQVIAKKFDLKLISIADLITYQSQQLSKIEQ